MFPLGGMVASPIVGKNIDKSSPKYFLTRGLFMLGICLVCFGLLDLLQSPGLITSMAILLRFVEGLSSACVSTACYSIATNEYPEQTDAIIGRLEAALGLGIIIGPAIGSFIYEQTSF